MITFNGLGSGLEVVSIVNAIVDAENVPFTTRLNAKEGVISTDISAVGALRSALEEVGDSLSNLANSDRFQLREATGNDDFISLASNKDAEVGNFSIKVDVLAEKHKVISAGINSEEAIGEGTLSFSSGENDFDVVVSDTATLSEIRDAINDNEDNDSIIATIITDDTGQHLSLSTNETGIANAITVTADDISDGDNTDNIGLSRLAYDPEALDINGDPAPIINLSETTPATDAQITIDGNLVVTSTTNTFDNVIDGVDITAKKLHSEDDDLSNIALTENNANIEAGLNQFVSKYNELIALSKQLGSSSESGAGPLAGDSLLRGVMSKLRQQLSTSFETSNGETLSLSQLGVRSERDGTIGLDIDDLNEFVANDIEGLQNFFVGSDDVPGFASSVENLLNFYTEPDGIIQGRIEDKQGQLEGLDDDRAAFAIRIEALESRLLDQYNAMDLLVSSLNATSASIQAQLNNLPGVVRQSNN
jgi:flagellar hook-associated protein 2